MACDDFFVIFKEGKRFVKSLLRPFAKCCDGGDPGHNGAYKRSTKMCLGQKEPIEQWLLC